MRIDDQITNTCTYIGPHIQLIVDPVPEINTATDISLCDEDGDGIISSFDLQSRTSEILGTQNPANFTLSFFLSEEDARNDQNSISSPSSYENTVPFNQSIYVRIENNTTGFFTAGFVLNLIAEQLPTLSPADDIEVCDDDTDGSAQNGIVQNIDLDARIPQILGTLDAAIHEVSFHGSQAEADSGANPIMSPFTNTTAFNQTIYIRLLNTNTSCFSSDSFEVIVNPEPNIQTISDQNYCDDDADGILSGIDLDSLIPSILGTLDPTDYTVSFHESLLEAENGDNPISSPYTNTTPNQQQLFIRVIHNITGCINTSASFNIVIQSLPIVNPPSNIEQCDDDTDGLVSGFNLDAQSPSILGSLDPTIHPVSYHLSESDAALGINPITNTSNFTNTIPNQQTIYVRVENTSTSCFVSSTSFDLIVNPIPEVNIPDDVIFCDDGLVDGSTTDGLAHNIYLEVFTSQILGSQNPADFQVTFHETSEEAQTGDNPIISPYSNSTPFEQTIYIRVVNTLTNCFQADESFLIIINPAPTIQSIGDWNLCDNDTDGDDANGFIQNIDLESQIENILGDDQNLDDFIITFHETLDDASVGENPLSSPYSNVEAFEQFIFVRVENIATGCVSFARPLRVVVSPLPQFEVITPQFICVGEDVLELGVENPEDSYDYFWIDADGETILGENITVTSGGTYSVTATNTDGSGCSKTFDIEVSQSSIPVLTEENIIIDDGDDSNSILINNNDGVLGIGDYEFALLDVEGDFVYEYQDNNFFGNLRGGIYTILARDKNGCGEAELEVALLEIPQFFTPNNDGINDFWNLKGITQEFIDYFPTTNISVFNRYGKFIANFTIEQQGWNGTYNGLVVISNDYWVKIELIDRRGRMRVETRNFALLRR